MTLLARVAIAVGALVAPGVLAPGRVNALEERAWQLAGAGAFAALATDRWTSGGGLGLELSRGLTDAWALRVAVDASLHATEGDEAVRRTTATVGLGYALDVLRLVPHADVSLAFLDVGPGAGLAGRRDLGLSAGAGFDYWLGRRWAAGLLVRGERAIVRLTGGEGWSARPSVVLAGLRVVRLL